MGRRRPAAHQGRRGARASAPCPSRAWPRAAPHLAALESLGLATAADLWKQPRAGLTRRFGGELLADIDRALGDLADPRTALQPAPVFDSRLELFMRADDSAALLTGAAVLLNRLTAWATAHRGLVAGFELRLHHESRRKMLEDPVLAHHRAGDRPGRAGGRHRAPARAAARAPAAPAAGRSVIEMSLHCHAITPGAPPNAELFPSAASVGEGWHRLLERFEARLGAHNIQRLQPVADHRPECATAVRRGRRRGAGARARAGRPLNLAAPAGPAAAASGDPAHWPRLKRPVWLLREPQPLRDEAGTPLLAGKPLWLVAGPERIEAGWWDGGYAARDYFIAQDHEGALLWVYRFRRAPEVGEAGWYLQGGSGRALGSWRSASGPGPGPGRKSVKATNRPATCDARRPPCDSSSTSLRVASTQVWPSKPSPSGICAISRCSARLTTCSCVSSADTAIAPSMAGAARGSGAERSARGAMEAPLHQTRRATPGSGPQVMPRCEPNGPARQS